MKALIIFLIAAGLLLAGVGLYDRYQKLKAEEKENPAARAAAAAAEAASAIPSGMPSELEAKYVEAQAQGAMGIKNFLAKNGTKIRDPRLGSIQLDYVVLVASKDIAEARKVFADVKKRTSSDSMIYGRVQQLAKTYE